MAGTRLICQTSAEVTTGTSAKTLIEYFASSGCDALLWGYWLGTKGTTATDPPGIFKIARTTVIGTGTTRSFVYESKTRDVSTYPAFGSCKENDSGEPTLGDLIRVHEIHPQGGGVIIDLPEPIVIPRSTGICLQVTFSVSIAAHAGMRIEE